jgi:hypothetical protein
MEEEIDTCYGSGTYIHGCIEFRNKTEDAVRRFERRFVEVVNEELYGPFCDNEAEPHLISKHDVSYWHASSVDERIESAVKKIREAIYDVFGEVNA